LYGKCFKRYTLQSSRYRSFARKNKLIFIENQLEINLDRKNESEFDLDRIKIEMLKTDSATPSTINILART